MFTNSFDTHIYIGSLDHNYILQIQRTVHTDGSFAGFITYDIYLHDNNPDHDFMVAIGHKMYPDDSSLTEDEKMEELQQIIKENLFSKIKLFKNLLAVYKS